jgi:hypothetical protein
MGIIKDDAIGGFNQFLKEQQKLPGKAHMTLVQFDDQYETVHDHVPLKSVPKLDDVTYQPRATTALLDAIGKTIVKADNLKAKQVSFVILTDGMENASREYNRSQIFGLITERQKKGWQFVFLAANQDAIQAGGSIGIQQGQSMTFAHTGKGVKAAYSASASLVGNYRSTGSNLCAFNDSVSEGMC